MIIMGRAQRACLAAGWVLLAFTFGSLSVGSSALAAESADSKPTSSGPESPPSLAVTINAAGFALFGPDLNLEVGSDYTGMLRLRGFGLGWLSHTMFTPEDNRHLGLDSFAIGAGGRAYLVESTEVFTGPYLGVAAEYLTVKIDEKQILGTLSATTTFLVPSLEGGYRLMLGPALVGAGAQLGYAFALSESCRFTAGSCVVKPRENTVYGTLVLDVGATF